VKKVYFSSATDMWATPQAFINKYDAVYNFTSRERKASGFSPWWMSRR
jgi:hypothetical protein